MTILKEEKMGGSDGIPSIPLKYRIAVCSNLSKVASGPSSKELRMEGSHGCQNEQVSLRIDMDY
jgi:hypothetical protein